MKLIGEKAGSSRCNIHTRRVRWLQYGQPKISGSRTLGDAVLPPPASMPK